MGLFAGQKSKEELAKGLPGYIPPGSRPKCLCCDRELSLNMDSAGSIDYGHAGNGVFCTKGCGWQYGLAVAKRVLHRKRADTGSSGNPLIDDGTISKPPNM